MNIKMQRFRSDMDCDPIYYDWSVAKTIMCVISDELQWGGKVISQNPIEINTRVFGCIDKTWITGTDQELLLVNKCIDAYKADGTQSVVHYLFDIMGLSYDNDLIYDFKDTVDLFKIYSVDGSVDSDLFSLIGTKKKAIAQHVMSPENVEQLKDQMHPFGLKADDGAAIMLINTVLGR